MFERFKSKFQCLQKQGQNSNVWEDKMRIPMLLKMRPENSSVSEGNSRIPHS